ncbi:MAG: ABC transporter permease [Clostridia bacterium]|nr:ABC transporter permease [Clostridia bacterium]
MTRRLRELMPLFILAVAYLAFAPVSPGFATAANAANIAGQVAPLAIVTVGQALVLMTGGFDISVGSVAALTTVAGSLSAVATGSFASAVLAAVLAGAVCGAANGFAVGYLGVQPVVATLGMLMFARGAALLLSGSAPVVGLPDTFVSLGYGEWLGVPAAAWVALAVVALMEAFLVWSPTARAVLAVGGNETAARLNGVPVRWTRFVAYLVCGALVGLAAIIYAARANSGQPTLGEGLELDSIAAAVIGGVSLAGGRGRMWGAAVGAVVVGMLANGLNLAGLSPFLQDVAAGITLLLAVWLQRARTPFWRSRAFSTRDARREVRPLALPAERLAGNDERS